MPENYPGLAFGRPRGATDVHREGGGCGCPTCVELRMAGWDPYLWDDDIRHDDGPRYEVDEPCTHDAAVSTAHYRDRTKGRGYRPVETVELPEPRDEPPPW